jgi:hypothetical protein
MMRVAQPLHARGSKRRDGPGAFLEQSRRDEGFEVRPLRLAGEQPGHARESNCASTTALAA